MERTRPTPALATPILGFSRETLQGLDRESLIQIVLNLQEEIFEQRIAVLELKDELRRLKGEKGRPQIKPAEEKSKRQANRGPKSGKTIEG